MQNDRENNFSFIPIILSLIMILSIVSRFSFSITVQISIFIFLSISALYLLNNFKISINSYIIPALLLILVSIISYIGADYKTNVRDYIIIVTSALLAGFHITFLSFDIKKKLLHIPVFIALFLSMILFSRFITNPKGFFYGDNFYEAVALNINVIAGFLILVYPLLFIFIKDKVNSKVYIAIAIFILIAIFLTRSRVAIFASIVITCVSLLEYRKNLYIKIGILLLSLLLLFGIIYVSKLKIGFNSIAERFIWWKTAYLIFKENILFGAGLGNYSVLFKFFRTELVLNTLYAHNLFMQLLSDIGILGLVSFIYLIITFYKKIIYEIKNNVYKYYYKIIALSITSFLFVNMLDYSFFIPANMIMFFIVFCSVFSVKTIKLKKERINTYLLTIIFLFFSVFIVKPIIANVYYKKGIELYVSKQYKLAEENFLKSVKFDKKNPEYYYQLSNTNFAIFDEDRENGKEYIDAAINFNKQAIELYKYGWQLRESLAYLYWNNNDKENAIKYIEEALKYDRFNPYIEEAYQQIKNS
ncbi:MAG: O-antigen ligase family protein [Endomicrobiaceae bacterium]|nr:O-antigen ligase family protein [Endomicrobiaceae bacterium]MDD3052849.1 O-antigen ligase family protein [Endomicrobiaceae bacterium]MDD3922636.1 O-antigen ligase family protein [Endomicrobiaceae bacterium]